MAVSWSLETPALVGELLPVRIQLTNNEAGDIGNVKLTLFTAVPNSKSSMYPASSNRNKPSYSNLIIIIIRKAKAGRIMFL